jgi:hypothetical protein
MTYGWDPNQPKWQITLFIQNASELPVEIHVAGLAIDTVGYKNVPASAGSEPQQLYADKRTGPVEPAYFFPGTVPPGHKWHGEQKYKPEGDFDTVVRGPGRGPAERLAQPGSSLSAAGLAFPSPTLHNRNCPGTIHGQWPFTP